MTEKGNEAFRELFVARAMTSGNNSSQISWETHLNGVSEGEIPLS